MIWPTGLRFRTFAAKLADMCMLNTRYISGEKRFVISAGKIGFLDNEKECCPLGAYTGIGGHPRALFFGGSDPFLTEDEAEQFIRGFDGIGPNAHLDNLYCYWELGVAYRKRYP